MSTRIIHRINFLWLIIILSVIGSSCEKNGGPPTFHFLTGAEYQASDTTLMVGDTIVIGLFAEWNGVNDLASIEISLDDTFLNDYTLNSNRGEYSFQLMKSVSEEEIWKFDLLDTKNNRVSRQIKLTKDPASVYGAVIGFQNIHMGTQGNTLLPGFIAMEGPSLHDLNSAFENQSSIDFFFYYDTEDGLVLASPDTDLPTGIFAEEYDLVEWGVRNSTRFLLSDYSPVDFNGIFHDGFLITKFIEESATSSLKKLAEGAVCLFRLESGRYGALLINSIIGDVNRDVDISIIIQKP